jgi:hypothetical protein
MTFMKRIVGTAALGIVGYNRSILTKKGRKRSGSTLISRESPPKLVRVWHH